MQWIISKHVGSRKINIILDGKSSLERLGLVIWHELCQCLYFPNKRCKQTTARANMRIETLAVNILSPTRILSRVRVFCRGNINTDTSCPVFSYTSIHTAQCPDLSSHEKDDFLES